MVNLVDKLAGKWPLGTGLTVLAGRVWWHLDWMQNLWLPLCPQNPATTDDVFVLWLITIATRPLLLLLHRGSCATIDTEKPTSDVNHESKTISICAITLGDIALHMLAMASIHGLRPLPTVRKLQNDKAKPTEASHRSPQKL